MARTGYLAPASGLIGIPQLQAGHRGEKIGFGSSALTALAETLFTTGLGNHSDWISAKKLPSTLVDAVLHRFLADHGQSIIAEHFELCLTLGESIVDSLYGEPDQAAAGQLFFVLNTESSFALCIGHVIEQLESAQAGFRRADIDIYERAKQRIRETRGVVVELTTCFRAIPALSTWANGVFKSLFPTAAIPQQPSYRDLNGVNEPGEAPCGIFQLCLPAAIERKQVPSTDARTISGYIASEVAAGRRKWGDFLVLTRKKEHLGLYADALERGHVSYEVSGSEAFQDSASVDALAALLYALANPDDAPSLVGVLRGPLFGLDDGTLFEYRRQGGQLLLNAPIDPNSSGSLVEALRNMQEMYRWTRKLPVGTAVERILRTPACSQGHPRNLREGARRGN